MVYLHTEFSRKETQNTAKPKEGKNCSIKARKSSLCEDLLGKSSANATQLFMLPIDFSSLSEMDALLLEDKGASLLALTQPLYSNMKLHLTVTLQWHMKVNINYIIKMYHLLI